MRWTRSTSGFIAAIVAATLLPAALGHAAAANPYPAVDTAFGANGFTKVRLPGSNWASDVAIAGGSRLYVVGSASNERSFSRGTVTALDASGHVVSSFGSSGSVTFSKGWTRFSVVEVQPDGRILVAGTKGNDVAVLRLRRNGAVDRGFGVRGWRLISVGRGYTPGYSVRMTLDSQGRILLAYSRYKTPSQWNSQAYLTRLATDGRIDGSFGKRSFDNGLANVVSQLAVDSSDRPVLTVDRYSPRTPNAPGILYRLRADGHPLAAFGGGKGAVALKATANAGTAFTGVSVDASGVLTVGFTGYTSAAIGVERLNADGTLDLTYGSGTGRFDTVCNQPCGVSSVTTPDGVVFVGATIRQGYFRRLYLARVLPDGSALDAGFGNAGQWGVAASAKGYEYVGLSALSGSTLVAVGGIQAGKGQDGLVTRFLLGP